MSTTHFAWLNEYVLLVSVAQVLLVGYWWRMRTHRLTFTAIGGAVIVAVWGLALFMPFEHTAVVQMPSAKSAATVDAIAGVISTVVITCMVVGINQVILLGVRTGLNRKRT